MSRADARAEHMCTQIDERGQAEQCSPIISSNKTHSVRQSPTIPGAVARYVEIPVDNSHSTKVITPCNLRTPLGDDSEGRKNCEGGKGEGKDQAARRRKKK